jgi:type 1 glutamine amidotransferase
MIHGTNGWLQRTAWLGALATMGSACAGTAVHSASGKAGAGGDSAVGATGGSDGSAATGGSGVGGAGGAGGSLTAGRAGAPPAKDGVGGSGGSGGGSAGLAAGGSAGSGVDPSGGMGGAVVPVGGMAGTGSPMGGMPGAGSGGTGGEPAVPPYAPRTGSFKVLAYSKTSGFRHSDAINAGQPMLMSMGLKQGFEVTISEDPGAFTASNLAQYEVVFCLNPTGNNLSDAQKSAFEAWMTMNNGGFAGVHAATDHENGWAFYSEVTGQYHDGHDTCCAQANIQWDPAALNHPTVVGLPSPWLRAEEWFKFNQNEQWSVKAGFQILSRVTTSGEGGTRPVSYVREWGNFRSFYTSLGHEASTYSDAGFVRHVGAGIMWAARREALFRP